MVLLYLYQQSNEAHQTRENKMNTLSQYWADISDKHIANIEKLVARYENATNENYQLILDQIKTEEQARDHAEAMFDKAMMQ
jgi:F0F1-type ATP synthase alpha subunit